MSVKSLNTDETDHLSDGEEEEWLDEALSDIYKAKFTVQVRSFVGNKGGRPLGNKIISGSSVEIFKLNLWEYVKKHIKQEVVLPDDEKEMHVIEDEPSLQNLPKFVHFYDKSLKKMVEIENVSGRILVSWATKNIFLYIYEYSNNINNRDTFHKIKSILFRGGNRDRGGAQTNDELFKLTQNLKDIHMANYRSQDINWRLWANEILSADTYLREQLMHEPPPARLIHLFARSQENSSHRLDIIRQGLSVAHTVNESTTSSLKGLKTTLQNVSQKAKMISDLVRELTQELEDLNVRVAAMDSTADTTDSLISAMENATGCQEDEFGRGLLTRVQEQIDIDHM